MCHTDEPCDRIPDPDFVKSVSPGDVAVFYSFLMFEKALEEGGNAGLSPEMRGALLRFGRLVAALMSSRCSCMGCVDSAMRAKYPELVEQVCDALHVKIVHVEDGESDDEAIDRARAAESDNCADKSAAAKDAVTAIIKQFTTQ